jgi:microsomal prostaglandin-E synthase 2
VSALASYLISRKPESRHNSETLKSIIPWYQNKEVIKEDGKKANEIVNRYFLMFGDIEEQKYKKIESSIAEERNWRRWADDYLVHTLSPNIYRSMDESLRSFRYFSDVGEWEKHFSFWERNLVIYLGASVMYFVGKKLKKKHCLKDDVRLSLYDACRHWTKAIGNERLFMGGDKPNLADLV